MKGEEHKISALERKRESGTLILFRLPFSFLTSDVIEATCKCMIDKASEAENVEEICLL